MTKPGLLQALACRVALTMMAVAATAAPAAGPIRISSAAATGWGDAASYDLETPTRLWSLDAAARGRSFGHALAADERTKRGSGTKDQAGADWSPRIGQGSIDAASALRLDRRSFNMETVPVTVLGRRFVLSNFTVNRKGVRGMISTGF